MTNLNIGVNISEGSVQGPIVGVATGVSGIIGNFIKGPLHKATLVTSFSDFQQVFGTIPAQGSTAWYSVKGFFQKVGSGRLYVVRVASSSALKASVTLQDRQGAPVNTLKVEAKSEGAWGNTLAVDIDDYNILSTKPAVTITAGATDATLVSVGGLEVGSDIQFDNGTNQEQKRLTRVDAATKKIYWSGGLSNSYTTANGTVKSLEFKLNVYQNGAIVETHTGLSMNDDVSFFCEKGVISDYITVTDLKATDTDYQDLPAVTSSAQALVSGNDGLSDVTGSAYAGSEAGKTGVYAFDDVPSLFRFCCPNPLLTDADPDAAYQALIQSLLDYAYARKTVQFYGDIPYGKSVTDAATYAANFEGRQLALFYPWGKITENDLTYWIPPSSLAMGAAVEKDYRRGVFKAVGNERISYITELERNVSDGEHLTLDDAGVTVLRIPAAGQGIRVYGNKTRSAVSVWKRLHESEYFNFLAQSFRTSIDNAVFEPNNEFLWKTTRRQLEAFLAEEQKKGALFSASDPVPYVVTIDSGNNPQSKIAQGILTINVTYVLAGAAEKIQMILTPSPTGLTVAAA